MKTTLKILVVALAFAAAIHTTSATSTPNAATPPQQVTVCATTPGSCETASVSYQIVPADNNNPCTYLSGTGPDTTYNCKVLWTVTNSYPGASCGWAYMVPTDQTLNCAGFVPATGALFPIQASGTATYTVKVGVQTQPERLWVCADYSLPTENCGDSPYYVYATMPSLDQHMDAQSIGAVLQSIEDTANTWVNAILNTVPQQ